jgi:5S rRNA maturation endonuclease (ribonuclease M5)
MTQVASIDDYKSIRISRLAPEERYSEYGASRMALCGPKGRMARDYLLWERGLDPGVISDFRLGYVPMDMKDWHPFAGRIVMPVMDAYDNLLALSVRAIIDGVEPKYWNESFEKSEHLYGLNIAKRWICRRGYAIIVEGQMDVMSMHGHGFCNTVGIMGGVMSHVHAQLLRRWAPVVVLLMDQDQAGQAHAENAMRVIDSFSGNMSFPELSRRKAEEEAAALGFKKVKVIKTISHVYDKFVGLVANLPRSATKNDPAQYLKAQGSFGMRWVLRNAFIEAGMPVPEDLE